MRRLLLCAAAALAAAAACTIPTLGELGTKLCDLDAGHACVSGYTCVKGSCVIPQGGSCTEGDSRGCGSDAGTCRPGTQSCESGLWGACVGEVGPVTESCDGKDNDCDGVVDDDPAGAPACPKQDGVCLGSAEACVDGGFTGSCTAANYGADYEATETSCDGKDNDCDGTADDGVTGGNCPNAGVCVGYQLACTAGLPGACQAPGYEAGEASCDGRDNDCDGQIDEGVISSGVCGNMQGVCAGKHPACVDGGFEPTCTALSYGADYQSLESTCDGKDNDCNGSVDLLADGGLLRVGACELSQGVCAGAQRACVAGNGEAPCTKVSYGAAYEAVESTCDGLDNDCDGTADRSKEVPLVSTPNATTTHLSLAAIATGYGAVYADERGGSSRVFFRFFNGSLAPQGAEVELSDAAALQATRATVTTLGNDFVATWREQLAGGWRVVVGRISSGGSVAWKQTAANEQVLAGPQVATSASPQRVVVAWVNSPALRARGAAWDGAGNVSTAATDLGPADAGGEQVFDVDVSHRSSANDFVLGWIVFAQSTFRARFQAMSGALVLSGSVREESNAPEQFADVRLAPYGSTGEVAAAWRGSVGTTNASVHALINATSTGASPQVIASVAGSMADLSLTRTAQGAAAFWSQGLPQPSLMARDLADGGVVNLTPPSVTGLFGATAAWAPGLPVAVGYESDRGQGLDLQGQLVCLP